MLVDRFSQLPQTPVLSIFCTAGFPRRDDLIPLVERVQAAGADMIEIGFPFSDPISDGPTIQASNQRALANGMNLELLFEQLKDLRRKVRIPVLLMGYLNPVEQYGVSRFLEQAAGCGIDGLILPDLPFEEYQQCYQAKFKSVGIKPVFLITSRTEPERIRMFDVDEPAFLYVVSSDAVTGGRLTVSEERAVFFDRLARMGLKSRLIVGFGVTDKANFEAVTARTHGAIIASAFLRVIAALPASANNSHLTDFESSKTIENFIAQIR